jgi:hypothetical protein
VITVPPRHREHQTSYHQPTNCSSSMPDRYPLVLNLNAPEQVLSREQLLNHVWGYDFDPGSNVVDVYVRYLRRKLGAERFVTLRRMGYRLDEIP